MSTCGASHPCAIFRAFSGYTILRFIPPWKICRHRIFSPTGRTLNVSLPTPSCQSHSGDRRARFRLCRAWRYPRGAHQAARCGGVVTDGGVRDASAVADVGLPVFAAGPAAPVFLAAHTPVDRAPSTAAWRLRRGCAGQDGDGVAVIPAASPTKWRAKVLVRKRLRISRLRSRRPTGHWSHPPDDKIRAEFEEWVAAGKPRQVEPTRAVLVCHCGVCASAGALRRTFADAKSRCYYLTAGASLRRLCRDSGLG